MTSTDGIIAKYFTVPGKIISEIIIAIKAVIAEKLPAAPLRG